MGFKDFISNSSFSFDPLGFGANVIGGIIGGVQNKQNLDFQKDAYEYQKWLNNQSMLREDNAVQRRVADLKSAGLSPYLAAGSSASSGSYSSGSSPYSSFYMPNFNSTFTKMSKMQLEQMEAQTELLNSQASIEETKAKFVSDNPMLLFQDNLFSRISALQEVFPNLSGQIEKFLALADGVFQSPEGLTLNGLLNGLLGKDKNDKDKKEKPEIKEIEEQKERDKKFIPDNEGYSEGYRAWLTSISGMSKDDKRRLSYDEFYSLSDYLQDMYLQYSKYDRFYTTQEWKDIKKSINKVYKEKGLKKRF